MKKVGNWLWGCVLVALGVILGLNALEITDVNLFFPGWWTLFIIVPSAISLLTERDKTGSVIGLVIGGGLLLGCLRIVSFGMMWKLIIPLILVGVGISLIIRNVANAEVSEKIRRAEHAHRTEHRHQHVAEGEVVEEKAEGFADQETYWSTFSDQKINYDDKEFTGCRLDVVFGGAELDLRHAKIKDEAVIRASATFGGIVVYVPKDVNVEVASMAVIGGVTDKRIKSSKNKENKTIYIDAKCVFGGLELR